ncbi:MAG: lysophospholipid acyltransferase family protein [Steroidobacteraceae bacterium]|jgi:1-acyl-sn-glycerol-3-phosphate acyltransferase
MRHITYGLYAWSVFVALGAVSVPVLLLTPSLQHRRAIVSALARLVLRLVGMRVVTRGLERIRPPCVVVANHASYLDGVVLVAVLPPNFSFVIKREMSAVPLAGTLLRRIGAEFVERRDRQGGARDTRRLLRLAATGQALVFFPEGTFVAEIGLLRFHIGAFVAAARANLPVIPVALRGTRACLPADHLLPSPGLIEVEVLAPLPAVTLAPEQRERPRRLRDGARAALLAALGEPDLAAPEQDA